MSKELRFEDQARKSLMKGVEIANDAVKVTMGSRGRNVIIENGGHSPIISKDGITVLSAIELKDPYENMGATLIKDISRNTNEESGDGSTTSATLGYSIFKEGLQRVDKGSNPIGIKRGIDKATELVVSELKDLSKPISSKEEIEQVATISANSDKIIGGEIATALDKVGNDGVVTVEESKTLNTFTEYVEGMTFDRGYISPYFSTDLENMTTSFEEPYILITDYKIGDTKSQLLPILELVNIAGEGKRIPPLLIICEDLEGLVLPQLIQNNMKGAIRVCGVKAPYFGDNRKGMLEDIAILTGGTFISKDLDMKLNEVTIEDLGTCSKITVDKSDTTIIGGKGLEEDLDTRIETLKTQIENSDSDYEIEKIKERLAKLSGGVAILNIGANTEVELKEKKDRVEDAISATRAGIEEGIISGGGTALAQIAKKLETYDLSDYSEDEKIGFNILIKAIENPVKQIAENSGQSGEVVVNKVKESPIGVGFNATTLDYVDMIKNGIIDPTKVARTALQSASSIAGLMLTTEVAIIESREDKGAVNIEHQQQGMIGR